MWCYVCFRSAGEAFFLEYLGNYMNEINQLEVSLHRNCPEIDNSDPVRNTRVEKNNATKRKVFDQATIIFIVSEKKVVRELPSIAFVF